MTVHAEFTRRATIITPDTAGMVTDTDAIRTALAAHRTEQTAMVTAVRTAEDENLPRRTRRAAWGRVEELESSRAYAEAQVIRAVQVANPGAEYAAVMATARAL